MNNGNNIKQYDGSGEPNYLDLLFLMVMNRLGNPADPYPTRNFPAKAFSTVPDYCPKEVIC